MVIAIIAILVALLLPAVQAAREAARRTHCSNNFKQIGLAMHNYHSAQGLFPPGQIYRHHLEDPEGVNYYGGGWSVRLLPYLEQGAIDDLWDWSDAGYWGVYGPNNIHIGKTGSRCICALPILRTRCSG